MLCPSRDGRPRLVAVLSDPASIGRYLSEVGFAADPRGRGRLNFLYFCEIQYLSTEENAMPLIQLSANNLFATRID